MYRAAHRLDQMTPADYQAIEPMLRAVETMNRLYPQMIIVADLRTRGFLYVSHSPFLMEEVRARGLDFFRDKVVEEDMDVARVIGRLASRPIDSSHEWVLSFHYRLQAKNRQFLVNQRLSVLVYDAEGRPWLVLCVLTRPARQVTEYIVGGDYCSTRRYRFVSEREGWAELKELRLSAPERMMLQLSARGFTVEEISEAMCRSRHTVQYYRRRVYEKFGVDEIGAALAAATCYCLI